VSTTALLSECYQCPVKTGVNPCLGGFNVYCLDGYVLLAKIDGSAAKWYYGSSLWTDATATLNPGSLNLDQVDARLDAYAKIVVSSVRVGFSDVGAAGSPSSLRPWLDIPLSSPSTLQGVMSAGTVVGASLTRAQWDSAVSGTNQVPFEPNCNINGLNPSCSNSYW